MTIQRFFEIWKYRFYKYNDVGLTITKWIKLYISVKISKFLNPNTKFICILLTEHFGDIVACEPFSRELKKRFPDSKIYWIVKKNYRELLDCNPNIETVVEEFSIYYSILLTQKNPFDLFYNCHLPNTKIYNYLNKKLQNPLADSLEISIYNYFDFGNILEVFAKISGLPVINEKPKLYIPQKVENDISSMNIPSKIITIHCHSNYLPKDWQVYHWEKLIQNLIETFDYQVIEIGLKSTLNLNILGYHNFCGRLSLLETAEIIKKSSLFIGIDSGPAHFANALETYGILLFGKLGEFNLYNPYSGSYGNKTNATFIVKDNAPCSELSYDEVWAKVNEVIKKLNL
jgi:heptosyltransferase III